VAKLLHQIVSILAHLHSKKIVHRDLKPENLLFEDETGTTLKLCDFGVAEKIPEQGYLTEIIGTESYMAPEVEEGKPYGVASDMYGFGVIMYIMLCGYPPFEPENGINELEFPEEEWATISPTIKELITSLLDHDPNKRPTAQEVLKNAWMNGETQSKIELKDTVDTMKIFNHYRASGNLGNMGSMRLAKANKKEAVWSIFSNGYSKKPKAKSPKLKKSDSQVKKDSTASKKSKKKESIPAKATANPTSTNDPKTTNTVRRPPPLVAQPTINDDGSKHSDELQLGNIDHVTRDPDQLHQTITLLESKLVSLSNINCALQSQVDEISANFNKLKLERDDLIQRLDDALQESETLRQKNEKKKKEKK